MQESLGISITNQVIKYAKLTKNNNQIDVASFGIKFSDDIQKDIRKIINETNSNNIPICMNTKDEKVQYFSIFGLLSKNDTKKTINTEFETLCSDKHINPNAYSGKYVIVNDIINKDRNKVIYVYESKNDLEEITSSVSNGKIKSITPISTSISNIADIKKGENSMIINIEDKTTVTTILNQRIYNIDTIPIGIHEVIDKINEKENSYSKSYEICKNTTIYTMETSESDDTNNIYLSYIIPTLFNIVQEVKKIKEHYSRIDRIYLTGLGTAINNIELYFQEYFKETKCEILKPYFAANNNKVNIKDYIEVNSAIALAMEGLDYGLKSLNFKTSNWKEDLNVLLHSDIKSLGKSNKTSGNRKASFSFDWNMKGNLKPEERWLIRGCSIVVIIVIVYSICSIFLTKQISGKTKDAKEVTNDTNKQIALVASDNNKVLEKKKAYDSFMSELDNANSEIESKRGRKNQIPTLLNQIVYIIPKSVQLTKIDNTEITVDGETKQHITITAQSKKYEQLAYFKAKIKNNGYLKNVTSTEGTKESDFVVVTIEGDLP